MLTNLLTVAGQVLVLFALIALGFILTKCKILNKQCVNVFTDIVLYFATPAVIVRSFFNMEFSIERISELMQGMLICIVLHIIYILLATLIFIKGDDNRRRVMRFAAIFSNAGYMGLPLQEAVLGESGVFYGAAYVVVFNLVAWSYGIILMSGDKKQLSLKKLLTNPGLIGILIGFLVFAVDLQLPDVLVTSGRSVINHMANLNTPLPMIVIGYYLATSDILKALKDKMCYINIFVRLIAFPALTLGILYLIGMRGTELVAFTIASSAPTAAMTTMVAAKFDRDAQLSVNIVSISTLFSIITMPIFVAVAGIL